MIGTEPLTPGGPPKLRRWGLYLALAALTVALYWPVRGHQFVNYDDPLYVTANLHVRSGLSWANVVWAFTGAHASNWHPLTWLSHMLDCQLFGQQPAAHHLVSVGLHAANSALLWLLLARLTSGFWRSGLVAGLFAWHPMHVESVAWVAERKDVLSTFFLLLTLLAYSGYVRAGQRRRAPGAQPPGFRPSALACYCLALGCFALGLMSKPMLVSTPLLLVLLDYWPLQTAGPGLSLAGALRQRFHASQPPTWWLDKVPFILLALGSCILTLWAQKSGGSITSIQALPWEARLATALAAPWNYIGGALYPAHLAVFYPYGHPALWTYSSLGAGLALASLTLLTLRLKRWPWLAVGWGWFVLSLLPVLGLVQVGQAAMADRYSYIPFIGLFIVGVFGLEQLARPFASGRPLAVLLGALLLLGSWSAARGQLACWKDSVTLFSHALAVTHNNFVACVNLGSAYQSQGRPQEARACYEQALKLNPQDAEAHNNLGLLLLDRGLAVEAEAHLRQSAAINPQTASTFYNLGNALNRRDQAGAAQAYRQALALDPEIAEAHNNLACLLVQQGDEAGACEHFAAAIRLKPEHAGACNNLGSLLNERGQPAAALPLLQQAVRLGPTEAQAHYNLANSYAALHSNQPALVEFEAALHLDSSLSWAHYKLGNLLLELGRGQEALDSYNAAVRTDTNFAKAYYQMATVLMGRHQQTQACQLFRTVLRLEPRWLEPLNNLAWLLATSKTDSLRNGTEALGLAQRAAQLSAGQDAETLDTLAAAYAEAGRFDEALHTLEQALELARKAALKPLLGPMELRLGLYRQHQPWRE